MLKIGSDYFLDFVGCVTAKACTVLILSCDMPDPIKSFLTTLNCFDSLFLSSCCDENWLRLFSWTSLGVYQPNKGNS